MSALDKFFDAQSEEGLKKKQQAVDAARTEDTKSEPVKYPGRYRCEVATYTYYDKAKDVQRFSPEISVNDKDNLLLNINLKTVDSTPKVPKGSGIFHNMMLGLGDETNDKGFDGIMSFTKPKLVALTGQREISFTKSWFKEWLDAEFKQVDRKWSVAKDHKMKQEVMVTVDEDLYNDKIVMKVIKIEAARPGEKSETFSAQREDKASKATDSVAVNVTSSTVADEDIPTQPEVEDVM